MQLNTPGTIHCGKLSLNHGRLLQGHDEAVLNIGYFCIWFSIAGSEVPCWLQHCGRYLYWGCQKWVLTETMRTTKPRQSPHSNSCFWRGAGLHSIILVATPQVCMVSCEAKYSWLFFTKCFSGNVIYITVIFSALDVILPMIISIQYQLRCMKNACKLPLSFQTRYPNVAILSCFWAIEI